MKAHSLCCYNYRMSWIESLKNHREGSSVLCNSRDIGFLPMRAGHKGMDSPEVLSKYIWRWPNRNRMNDSSRQVGGGTPVLCGVFIEPQPLPSVRRRQGREENYNICWAPTMCLPLCLVLYIYWFIFPNNYSKGKCCYFLYFIDEGSQPPRGDVTFPAFSEGEW